MSSQEIGALIKSVNDMTGTVAGKMGAIDKKVDSAIDEFQSEVDKFYSVGNFRNLLKTVGWVGDSSHYNYVLLHMEPSEAESSMTDDQSSPNERFGFAQYGEIFAGRISSGYSSMIFGRFIFHSCRGYGDVSLAKVETPFTSGFASPVIVKNFPHDGKLFRALRFSPMSFLSSGLSLRVCYNGDFRGTGATDRNNSDNKYWLKSIGVAKTESQPGEIVV